MQPEHIDTIMQRLIARLEKLQKQSDEVRAHIEVLNNAKRRIGTDDGH